MKVIFNSITYSWQMRNFFSVPLFLHILVLTMLATSAVADTAEVIDKFYAFGGCIYEYENFGQSVAIDDDIMVFGAPGASIADLPGSVYIMRNYGSPEISAFKLDASDGETGDSFGKSVAFDGDTLIIGAPNKNTGGNDAGAVYIFQWDGSAWIEKQIILASDAAADDEFGRAVAISGDTLVVGAWTDDDPEDDSGSAYVFYRHQGGIDNWGQVQKLTPTDGAAYQYFGHSVAIDGDTVVVGAYGDADNGNFSGSVYLFDRHQGGVNNWGQVQKITASDGEASDYFGISLAIDGDTLVAGATGDDDLGSRAGAAYIFQWSGLTWVQSQKLTAGGALNRFGESLDLSEGRIIIGASYQSSGIGAAYVFGWNGVSWVQHQYLTASEGMAYEHFGKSVAIDAGHIIIGAPQPYTGGDPWYCGEGKAYMFEFEGSTWNEQQTFRPLCTAPSDGFGTHVLSVDDLLVVSGDDGRDYGNVWIYSWDGTLLSEQKKLTATDAAVGDRFGDPFALSSDVLVVGSPRDDDLGDGAGSIYIYYRNQGGPDNWGSVKKITSNDGGAGDNFGISVAITGDTVVVGASGDDDNGDLSGSAYVFYRHQGGTDNWGQIKKIAASDASQGNYFGLSAAIAGDILFIGAPADDSIAPYAGSVYVFYRHQGGSDNWGQVRKITAADGDQNDHFGDTVSFSADTLLVGTRYAEAAYVFDREQGGVDNWGQVHKIVASDSGPGDMFGRCVSIDADTAVVGARLDDDQGNASGSVYIFERHQGGVNNWGQAQKITAVDGEIGDYFGTSVSIRGDFLLVGATRTDDAGDNFGSAYLYELMQDVVIPGDIDDNDVVDLADVIVGLQTISGSDQTRCTADADVNGDGRVGLEEVIFIMQNVSGFR